MESLYPAGPVSISDELMQVTPGYKRRAWIAFSSLILFIVLYVSLTGWFIWKSYVLISDAMAGGNTSFIGYGFGAAAAFLALFLIKALFFIKHGGDSNDMEITEEQYPELFEFLYKLADEANAPRPHRVFLSARVNAAVFYNLTFLNLIFPSIKNLEIGLPLVNSLTLGELKAVLAHEFGHFRQGSMVIGRWIYIAQQIATHIIQERGILDNFLNSISRFDIRIAWIGWVLRIVVWSLRVILDTTFSLVVLAERSLSREMEFQADLVSVSLTGSDALIHALYKLNTADDCWQRALEIASAELSKNKAVKDVFVIQKIITANVKRILDDDTYDNPPPLPGSKVDEHRVFKAKTAHPPQMWSTHPANNAREDNAKKIYISAPLDERPAWVLFKNPKSLREKMTSDILNSSSLEGVKTVDIKETMRTLDKKYKKQMYNRRYNGVYLGRSVVRNFASVADMYKHYKDGQNLTEGFKVLYSKSFAKKLEQWRNLEEEKETLEALYDGRLKAPDGVFRHQGNKIKRRKLPSIIAELGEEIEKIRREINSQDMQIRGINRAAAKQLGKSWEQYLLSLGALLHYAEHSRDDVNDARAQINNVWAVITADGKVSKSEQKRLLKSANDVFETLTSIESNKTEVVLCPKVASNMDIEKWTDVLSEEFKLPAPTDDNINDWLTAIDSWFDYFGIALDSLSQHTLEVLLTTEAYIEKCYLVKKQPGDAPAPGKLPRYYKVLLPEAERELQKKLGWWDRFQIADGLIPGLARFSVAGAIFGSIFFFGIFAGKVAFTIYNGLGVPVVVSNGELSVNVMPYSSSTLEVTADEELEIVTTTKNGDVIEKFNADASNSLIDYVYNVASAAPLIEWSEIYGVANSKPPRFLGTQRWTTSTADYLFKEPPESIKISGKGTTKDVLSGFGNISPDLLDQYLPDDANIQPLVLAHAKWDNSNSKEFLNWLQAAFSYPEFSDLLKQRLIRNPDEVITLRLVQDLAEENGNEQAVCKEYSDKAKLSPDNLDWQYLAVRCITDRKRKTEQYLSYNKKYPKHAWFGLAAGYIYADRGDWEQALIGLKTIYDAQPALRNSIAETKMRILRAIDRDESTIVEVLLKESASLKTMVQVETGKDITDEYIQAHHLLAVGKLDEAISLAETLDEATKYKILRLAAASDGASEELITKANALTVEQGISNNTYWSALALATKQKMNVESLMDLIEPEPGSDSEILLKFLEAVEKQTTYEDAQVLLSNIDPKLRGVAYSMGLIIRGQSAPEEWRDGAKNLLFSSERPYFL